MAPHKNECKKSGPITPSGSKPITNQDLTEILTLSQRVYLLQWKLSSFDGNPLQWLEWFCQFKNAIDAKVMFNDVKQTYLNTLVLGKAKNANAEFTNSGTLYKNALKTLEREFGEPKTILCRLISKNFRISPL